MLHPRFSIDFQHGSFADDITLTHFAIGDYVTRTPTPPLWIQNDITHVWRAADPIVMTFGSKNHLEKSLISLIALIYQCFWDILSVVAFYSINRSKGNLHKRP